MSKHESPPKSPTLLPPRKSVELEDPGAHELDGSENDDEVFADAQEERASISRPTSPIPLTRVEKVDDREAYGDVPGTKAYALRTEDAVPDEVEVVPENAPRSRSHSHVSQPTSPGGSQIPKTVVDKVDTESPSHGDVPGTAAYAKRAADAVPDVVRSTHDHQPADPSTEETETATPVRTEVPTTIITKVDSEPRHGELSGTEAHALRKQDANPDIVEKEADAHTVSFGEDDEYTSTTGLDNTHGVDAEEPEQSASIAQPSTQNDDNFKVAEDDDFGDDFDDFEAGNEQEDFGAFDDTMPDLEPQASLPQITSPHPDLPLLDFSKLETLDDITDAMKPYLEQLFPSTLEAHPDPPPPPSGSNPIFLSERSLSLWSQLIATPPLQPPNWVRSRIRRLFLVSLGVPVDLDEILPASKQKKLVLPSIHTRSDSPSSKGHRPGSRGPLRHENASSSSLDKSGPSSKTKRRKGPPSPPELDVHATRLLCTTTREALSNMTDDELRGHLAKVEELTVRASEVLEFWLKRRDSALGDKEAFEGVIENLVRHARRVRK